MLGDVVRRRREELGMTQTEAAAAGGVSMSQWQKIEYGSSGRPTARTIAGLARALRMSPDVLRRAAAGDEPAAPEPDAGTGIDEALESVESALDALERARDALRVERGRRGGSMALLSATSTVAAGSGL